MDPNTGAALYESADIIDYLYREYGGRPAPRRWLVRSLRTAAAVSASLPRASRGLHVLDSQAPEQALELYSFEASPFARLVRERLTELQLPYLLRQCGRDQWQDWVLPPVRRRLLDEYTPRQRNRVALMERAGRIAVPYLVDPNTGAELFESADILDYLDQTYGR
jgi:glutathione S-transferase